VRKIRKPAQEFLDENLLRSVPVKVTYTTKHSLSGIEHASTLGGIGSVHIASILSKLTLHANAHERMMALMKEIEQEALILQGLPRHPTGQAAMQSLIAHAMQRTTSKPERLRGTLGLGKPSWHCSDRPLAMHPAIEKACSGSGDLATIASNMELDRKLAASLGARCNRA
jgi:hypothetical protein